MVAQGLPSQLMKAAQVFTNAIQFGMKIPVGPQFQPPQGLISDPFGGDTEAFNNAQSVKFDELLRDIIPRVKHLNPGDVLVCPAGWTRPATDGATDSNSVLIVLHCKAAKEYQVDPNF